MTALNAAPQTGLVQPYKRTALPAARVRCIIALLCVAFAAFAPIGAASQPANSPPEQAATDIPRRVVIRFLTEGDFPPFNFYDEDGILTGLNVDLARAICLEMNTSCDIKVRPWDELLPALKRGDADAVIAAHTVTAEALAQVDFTQRYFHTPGRFAAVRGREDAEITPEGLDGKRIAVAKGTAHEAFLRAFFRDSRIETYANADLAREALAANKADLVFDDAISLSFWINGTLSRQCCEVVGGPFLEPKFFGDGIAIAVSKTDPQIKVQLNTALSRVRETGRFEELVNRYFPTRIY